VAEKDAGRKTVALTLAGKVVDAQGLPVARAAVAVHAQNVDRCLDPFGFDRTDEGDALAAAREPRSGVARRIVGRIQHGDSEIPLVDLGHGETQADGTFRIKVRVPVDKITPTFLVAELGDAANFAHLEPDSLRNAEGNTLDAGTLALRPTNLLTVVVRSGGSPCEGATVAISAQYARGGETDNFEFKKVAPADGVIELPLLATYIGLTVSKPGFGIETRELHQWKTVRDYEDGAPILVAFDLVAEAQVAGIVRGPDGPVAGVRTSVHEIKVGNDGQEYHSNALHPDVFTDAQGRFAFGSLRRGGRYWVYAETIGRSSLLNAGKAFDAPCTEAVVALGRAARIHCEAEPARGEKVTVEGVAHLGLFELQRWDEKYGQWSYAGSSHDLDRKCDLERLEPGRYRVSIFPPGLAPTLSREVVLGEGDEARVSLELTAGRRVTGRLVASGGVRLVQLNGRREEVQLGPDGSFALAHVPPNDAELEVYTESGKVTVTIPAAAVTIPDVVVGAK
jgi:hypothetical protein